MTQCGLIFNDGTTNYQQNVDATAIYVYDLEYALYNLSEVEIDHGGAIGIIRYEASNVEATNVFNQPATRDGTVYKVNLSTAGTNNTSTTGLKAGLTEDTTVTIRSPEHLDLKI